MKKLQLATLTMLLFAAFSCKKDNSSVSAPVSSDQAADIAAGALSANSNGFASMSGDLAANAQLSTSSQTTLGINSLGTASFHQECGTTVTDSASHAGSEDSVSWNYFVKYSHTLFCDASGHRDSILNTSVYHGSYDGPRVSSTNSGTATASISGLLKADTCFVLNGEFKRTGTYTYKIDNKGTFNASVDIVAHHVLLSKPGRKVMGGTATITVSGTSPKGSYNYNGTVTFSATGSAVLKIQGGGTYAIDLRSGFRIRKG